MRTTILWALALLFAYQGAWGQIKFPKRPYEPVILYGSSLKALEGIPVSEIGGYAYDAASGEWRAIPVQVDEVGPGPDAFFVPDDGLLDGHPEHPDEVVFMLRDAGDRAPLTSWPTGTDRQPGRIEVELADDEGNQGFVYLFRVPGGFTAPDEYGMSYDPNNDAVASRYYRLSFRRTIVLKDLAITPDHGGNGLDLVDTQKIRLKFRVFFQFYEINEELDIETLGVEAVAGPVRVIRRVKAKIPSLSMEFATTSRFYPFSMEAGGGRRRFDAALRISLIRQSLDLNENAVGMKFINPHNPGITIDGNPDTPDRTLNVPGYNWILLTGQQGSIVSILDVPQLGDRQLLYYLDNASGGTDDDTQDTGDGKSYGDVGVKLLDNVAGEYDFANTKLYFLPPNQTAEAAEQLVHNLENPIEVGVRSQQAAGVQGPPSGMQRSGTFDLVSARPNPFRESTEIAMRPGLHRHIEVRVFDVRGRVVTSRVVRTGPSGSAAFHWTGTDSHGRRVPAGIYFVQIVADGQPIAALKLVRIQ